MRERHNGLEQGQDEDRDGGDAQPGEDADPGARDVLVEQHPAAVRQQRQQSESEKRDGPDGQQRQAWIDRLLGMEGLVETGLAE